MKNRFWLLSSLLLVTHCGDETLEAPQIAVDLTVVQLGDRSIAEDAPPKEFNLLIQNKGEDDLIISSAVLKGDQNCAFELEGPDKKTLGEDGSAFIRITYKPTVRAVDNVNLIIKSNSEEKGTLKIPICGEGKLPEEIVSEDTDSSSDTEEETEDVTDDDLDICDYAPDDQPDCEMDTETEEE